MKPSSQDTLICSVPKDWDIASFDELFNISAGGDVDPNSSSKEQDESHPYPIYSNSTKNRGLYGYCSYADNPAHSITITARGTLGVATYRDSDYTAVGRVLVLDPKKSIAGPFITEYINNRVSFAVESTGVPQLTAPQIGSYFLALPPYFEQREIATVLEDLNRLIHKLDQLIAKKQDLKQAVAQQLLAGRIRLPGFENEWRTKPLATLVTIRNEKTLPASVDVSTLCVELDHLGQNNGRLLKDSTAAYSKSTKYRFRAGDVLFGRLRSYLRKYWHADRDGICSTEIWPMVVDSKQIDSRFLFAVVQSDQFINAASKSYGTHMPRADWGILKNLDIRLPPIHEQRAITTVLSEMDSEIVAFESQCNKTSYLKQAMLQELLTGSTRLVEPETSHA
ncbi:MAG: restriction endonuclease subunit S [Gammaproteobacteria bacterium]|nr:restriction endonuclease subunit S [Gammaproteobacteria bacterium]